MSLAALSILVVEDHADTRKGLAVVPESFSYRLVHPGSAGLATRPFETLQPKNKGG